MNASQYEEVKDGPRGMKGMPRRSRRWRFVPLAGRIEESEDRHEGDVHRTQSPRSFDNNIIIIIMRTK